MIHRCTRRDWADSDDIIPQVGQRAGDCRQRNHNIRSNRIKRGDRRINLRIKKFFLKENLIEIISNNKKKFSVKNLILCIGNLNLIRLMYYSNLLHDNDVISFDDSNCSYVFNFCWIIGINIYIANSSYVFFI